MHYLVLVIQPHKPPDFTGGGVGGVSGAGGEGFLTFSDVSTWLSGIGGGTG